MRLTMTVRVPGFRSGHQSPGNNACRCAAVTVPPHLTSTHRGERGVSANAARRHHIANTGGRRRFCLVRLRPKWRHAVPAEDRGVEHHDHDHARHGEREQHGMDRHEPRLTMTTSAVTVARTAAARGARERTGQRRISGRLSGPNRR